MPKKKKPKDNKSFQNQNQHPKEFRTAKEPYQLSPAQMEQSIIGLLSRMPQERWDVKSLTKKLNSSNSKQEFEQALTKLHQEGKLEITRNGSFKWHTLSDDKAHQHAGDAVIGRVDMTRNGDAYIVSEQKKGKDIFVASGRLKGAMNGDTVKVRWKLSKRGKPEGSVVEIVQRKTNLFVGTLSISKNQGMVVPDDFRIPTNILVDKLDLNGAKDGDKVVVAVVEWQNENKEQMLRGKVQHNLGKTGSNDAEMLGILIQNGFNIAFPEEVQAESEAISTEIPAEEIAKRRDFRSILTFTIDPEDAKDFDDAISLETLPSGNVEIGVHIADVSHYVLPGSELDKEAARRTTSVYLVDRVAPMLPEKLSNGVCSLRPDEEKLTFSAVFEFTTDGKLVKEWFGKTVIRSARRYSYEQVQEILETGVGDNVEALKTVNSYAQRLKKERFRKGAINFESLEVKFRLDENGKVLAVIPKVRKDAHFLIEEFMLLANRRVSAHIDMANLKRNSPIPFVYRVHDLPDMEKIADFMRFAKDLGYELTINTPQQVAAAFEKMQTQAADKPELMVLQQLGIRTMSKAAYSTDNIGHYGLAFDTYTHFTSPIRRYSDVLSHRILQEQLINGKYFTGKEPLEMQCKHISAMERKAMEAERESVKYKQAEFMQDHVGDTFEGVISGVAEHGIYVELLANYCEGLVRFDNMYAKFILSDGGMHIRSGNRSYKMGDKVWVSVLGADARKRQIDLRLLDEKKVKPVTSIGISEETTAPLKPQLPLPEEQPITTPEAKPEVKKSKRKKAGENLVDEPIVEPIVEETPKIIEETPPAKKSTRKTKTVEPILETPKEEVVEKTPPVEPVAKKSTRKTKTVEPILETPAEEVKVVPETVLPIETPPAKKTRKKAVDVAPSDTPPTVTPPVEETKQPETVEKEKPAKKPLVNSTPILKKNVVQSLLDALAPAYLASEAIRLATQRKQRWYYKIAETELRVNRPTVVLLCPEWQDSPQPPTLTNSAKGTLTEAKHRTWQGIAQSMDAHFAEQGGGDQTVVVPYCPYVYPSDMSSSKAELLSVRPYFDKLLGALKPTSLLVFSSQLRFFWKTNQYLSDYKEENIAVGKRSVSIAQGFYVLDGERIPVYFLPHPNAPISAEQREEIWKHLFDKK